MLQIAASVAQPFFLGKVVDFVSNESSMSKERAYLYATGLCVLGLFRASTYHLGYFAGQREFGMHMRTALTALVYKKVKQCASVVLCCEKENHRLVWCACQVSSSVRH